MTRIKFVAKIFSVLHSNNLISIFLQQIYLIFGLTRQRRMLSLTVELRSINNLNAPIYVNYKDRRADFERRVFALKSPVFNSTAREV